MAKTPELVFPPIRPDHAEAIGYVAANWSLVESQLAFMIYSLLGLQTIPGWAATAELSTLQRVFTVAAFVNLTGNNKWIDTWDDITKTFEDLRNRRNEAVHSVWEIVGPTHWRLRVKARGRVTVKQGPLETKALNNLANEILVLLEEMGQLTFELLRDDAAKIINQPHPPGWLIPAQNPSQKLHALPRNPKRARQMRRRALRRRVPEPDAEA